MTQVLDVPDDATQQKPGRKPLKFPTAFTVLGAVLLVVWALSFVIPSGTYEIDAETGGPVPGTYTEIDTDKSFPHQFYKLWNAPTNGLYGIQNEAGNVSVARAVTVVMKNAQITDTLLHWTENAVTSTSSGVFAGVVLLVNLPIAFLVPSSSGHAALVMPILAPLADFAGVPRSLAVTAYQSVSGLTNLVTPTSAVIMGGLALSRVGYDRYLRFVLPFFGIALAISLAFVVIGAALS